MILAGVTTRKGGERPRTSASRTISGKKSRASDVVGVSLGLAGPLGAIVWIASAALLLPLDALVDLFAMNRDVLRRVDADAHLVSFDPKDRDGDIVADHHGL